LKGSWLVLGLVGGSAIVVVLYAALLLQPPSMASAARPAQSPPYPPSPVIASVSWDFEGLTRKAQESDLFPLTWADDDDLYTAWGDGWGFSGWKIFKWVTKKALGVSRVSGNPPAYTGTDLWSGDGKSQGIICIDGVLYMIVIEEGNDYLRAKVGRSTDHGKTWTFDANWTWQEPGGAFAGSSLLQLGKDYQGARDAFVYGYSEKVRNVLQPDIVLFRVPKTQLMDRRAYEFFAGLDGDGTPRWTADISGMQPVFSDPNGVGWGMQATYHPVLRRYLLTVRHDDSAGWGIFDAPEPWGPWTTVAYYDHWIDSRFKFTFSFNQKWMNADGKTLWMVFSGTGIYDSFNVIKATLELR
jgi:Domain of unknown function (DUF4185)